MREDELERAGQSLLSDQKYNEIREQLIMQIAEINTVCNMNGKGRDDLTDIGILQAAEEIPK